MGRVEYLLIFIASIILIICAFNTYVRFPRKLVVLDKDKEGKFEIQITIAWILVFIIPLLNLATLVIIGICLLCMGIINTIKNIPEFISKTLTKFSNIEERK